MSIPHASQQQIDEMNKIAMQKYGLKDDQAIEPVIQDVAQLVDDQVAPVQDEQESYDDGQESGEDIQVEPSYTAPAQETNKEYNLRILRERAERAERERDELMRSFIANQQPQQKQAPQQDVAEEDFSLALDDESLVEGKHAKKLAQEVATLKKMMKSYEQQFKKTDAQTIEMRLQAQYPDFNKVMTHDNLARLRQANPDLADSILQTPDQFKQAKLAYEMVKQYGIYKDEAFEADRVLAQKNSVKPRPLTSISPTQSDTPLSKVNAFANAPLTKEVKQNLYQEMLQAMKGI